MDQEPSVIDFSSDRYRWCEPYLDQKFLENVDFKWTDEIHGITENVLIIMLRDTQKAPDERRGTTSVKNFFLVPWSPLEFPEAETFPDSETEPHFYIPDPSIVATRFKYLNMKFVAMQLYPERWEWKSTGPLQECDEFLGSSYVASEKGQENQMIDKSSLQKEALKFAIRKNPAIFAQVKAQAAEMFRVTKSLGFDAKQLDHIIRKAQKTEGFSAPKVTALIRAKIRQEEEIEAALSALEPTVAQPEPVDKELEDLHQQMDTKVEGETPEEVAQKSKLKDDLTQVLKEMVEAQEPSRTFGSTEKESESFTSPGRNQNFSPRKRNKKEDWEMEMENGINRTAQIGHYLPQWSDISIPGGKGHKARRFVKRRHGLPLRMSNFQNTRRQPPKESSPSSGSQRSSTSEKQSYRNKKSKKRPFKRIVRSSTETSPQSESPEKLASESSFEECSVIEPEEPQVEVKTVVFEPIREKCSICLSLDTLEAGFSKVSCQGRPPCTMIIHRSCMTNAMAVQNLTRKKEFKDAICPTDGCEAPLDRITDLHADGSEGKPLLCNQSTKEKIPESKGKDSKSTKPKKNEDKKKRNRLVSQIGSIDELESYVVVENEPELEPEPETKIEPELKPKNIITNPDEAGLKTVRLEKKQDEVVEKYSKGAGIHKTINRKDRKDSSSKPLVLGCLGYLGSPEKSNRHALNVVVNDVSKTEPKIMSKTETQDFSARLPARNEKPNGLKIDEKPAGFEPKKKNEKPVEIKSAVASDPLEKAETTSEYLGFEKISRAQIMEQGDKKQEIRKFAEKLKPFLNEIASNTPSFLSPLRVLFEAIEKVLGWKLTDGDRSAIRNLTTGDKDLLSEFAKDEGVNARFSFIPQDDNRFFRKKAPAPTLGPERQPRPETSQTFPKTELVYRVPQNPKAAEKKENLTAEQEEFMKMPQIELVNLVIKLKEENRKLKRIDPAMNGNTQIRTYGSRTDNTPSQSARSVKPNNCTYFRQEDPLVRPKSQQNRSSRQKNGAGPSKIQVEVPKKEPLAVVKVEKKPEISISFLEINEESKKAAVETQKVMQELDEFLKMAERVNLLGAMGRLEMRKNAILNVYSIAVQNIHHYEQEKFREMQPLPPIPQPDYEDYRRIRQIFNDFCDSNDDQVQTPTSSSSHEFLASNNVPATSSFTAKPNIFAANPWRNSGNNKKEDVVELLDRTEICPFCSSQMTKGRLLACEICGNYAHATCYGVWLERNGTCIHCRSSLKDPQEYPTLA